MDLGATVCTPRDPDCPACPLSELCRARGLGMEKQLPTPRSRKSAPLRRQVALLVERHGRYLVRPRPAEGFLGGLWELPVVDLREGEAPLAAAARLARELGFSAGCAAAGRIRHAYSHFTLELELMRLSTASVGLVNESDWQWRAPAALAETPLHGAHRKALQWLGLPVAEGSDDE